MSHSADSPRAASLPETDPLDLLVYSMPQPDAASAPPASGRGKLLALVGLCTLPLLAAFLAYQVLRPQGRASAGELIVPVRVLPAVTLSSADGDRQQALHALKGQWLLLGVSDAACAADCQQRLYLQRQLRETLNKDKDRVDRVWLLSDAASVSTALRNSSGDALLLRASPALLSDWLTVAAGQSVTDYLYVIDPLGNLMMRLPARFDAATAARARRDLERLLRASAAWDAPGR